MAGEFIVPGLFPYQVRQIEVSEDGKHSEEISPDVCAKWDKGE